MRMLVNRQNLFRTILFALTVAWFSIAAPAMAKNPYAHANNTWITPSGEIKIVTADSFLLDYGSGQITVEMDDGDRDADGYKLVPGDKVTVNGMVETICSYDGNYSLCIVAICKNRTVNLLQF